MKGWPAADGRACGDVVCTFSAAVSEDTPVQFLARVCGEVWLYAAEYVCESSQERH